MVQSLANKYRPKKFSEMVGQPIIATVLSRMVTTDRVPPALLFSGPSGTGKTTAARILASELASADVIEIDAASKGKVDDIRQLRNMLTYSAGTSHRLILIDEVQSMMSAAFNALLEALEEPPEGVIFVLVTTEPFSLPEAVRYRPIGFEFNSVTAEQIFARLKFVAEAEGIDADDSLLSLLASESQGNVRRAIMMLELAHIGEFKTAAEYRKAQGASDYAPVLLAALLSGDHGLIFENLDKVIHKVGNPSIIATEILKTFADMLILKSGGDIHKSGRALEYRKTLSSRIDSQRVLSACKLLWDLKTKIKVTDDLRGDLELALILLSDILTKNNPNAVRVKKPEQSQPMTADDMKEFTT